MCPGLLLASPSLVHNKAMQTPSLEQEAMCLGLQ